MALGAFGTKEGDLGFLTEPKNSPVSSTIAHVGPSVHVAVPSRKSLLLQLQCPTKRDCEYPEENKIQCLRLSQLRREMAQLSLSERPLLSQGPLRGDGVGARVFAHIYVMIVADFLGFKYAASSIGKDVTAFGPTRAEEIDWNCFLNLGAGFVQREDQHATFVSLKEGIEDLLATAESPIIRHKAYEIPHGFTFLDDKCWYGKMWGSYAKVSATLSSNYKNARVVRPACPYDAGTMHVAIHMRRGDVMKGAPELLTRCGKKIFPNMNPDPAWRNYFMEDFDRRSNDWAFFLNIMKTILRVALSTGNKVKFHIFSQTSSATKDCPEGVLEDFPELQFPQQGYKRGVIDTTVAAKGETASELKSIHIVLNNEPSACFHCLAMADVLVVAKSTFSMVAAVLAGPKQIKIYPPKGESFEHHKAGKEWLESDVHGHVDAKALTLQVRRRGHQGKWNSQQQRQGHPHGHADLVTCDLSQQTAPGPASEEEEKATAQS